MGRKVGTAFAATARETRCFLVSGEIGSLDAVERLLGLLATASTRKEMRLICAAVCGESLLRVQTAGSWKEREEDFLSGLSLREEVTDGSIALVVLETEA